MMKTTPVGLMSHHFAEILNDPNFNIFYHAPVLILISAAAEATEDCALAAENLMLAACDAGLGTYWIGFAQTWLGTAEGKALLKFAAAYRPVAPISSAIRKPHRLLSHAKSRKSAGSTPKCIEP